VITRSALARRGAQGHDAIVILEDLFSWQGT
jgi:hypothetical protein